MTAQPTWRLVANLGDVNPIDYGGCFVYVDDTGVYDPELEYLDAPDEDPENPDDAAWTVYRVCLDPCTFVDGVLSDNPFHPEHPAWFADSLESVATSMDYPVDDLRVDLCGADPVKRAEAYRAILDYHGWENGDAYPLQLTRAEATKRYDGLKPGFGEPV